VKDRCGAGSRVAQVVRTPEELGAMMVYHDDLVIQPVLKGQEYTADLFFDWDGKLIDLVVRRRMDVLNGQMDYGETVDSGFAAEICHLPLQFVGPINVQFFETDHGLFITDINIRFSGGIGLTIASGADFALYLYQMVTRQEIVHRESAIGTRAIGYADYVFDVPGRGVVRGIKEL